MINCCQFCLNFAFKFNLRRYTMYVPTACLLDETKLLIRVEKGDMSAGAYTRSHFSSTWALLSIMIRLVS
jgi:hypothetical protein